MLMQKLFRFFLKMLFLFILSAVLLLLVFRYARSEYTTNTDHYIYSLPYAQGTAHKVVQGYGGLFSHQQTAALDFEMRVGTPVYAARGGVIYRYKDDSNEGGILSRNKRKANYIIIQHSDGSFGCYWHLQQNGVLIKKGRVKEGEQIGFSGATGMVVQSHLHFSVKRKLNYDMNSFVQTKFKTTDGILIPEQNKTYERP